MTNSLEKIGGKTYNLQSREERIEYGIKKWEKMICGMAAKYKSTISDYDDIIQEAMLLIVNAADHWAPERGTFGTFSHECIKNGIMDVFSRNLHAVVVPSGSLKQAKEDGIRTVRIHDDIADESGDVFELFDLHDTIETFDHFRVGKMYFIEKLTMAEIADMTGISRSRIGRIILKMKQIIKNRLEQ